MSASLVGSEMCIRDRPKAYQMLLGAKQCSKALNSDSQPEPRYATTSRGCLLYTSDAADDM
eukprot:8108124-Alexandrium_andersonii.AAC.1